MTRPTRPRPRCEPLEDRSTPALAFDPTFGDGGTVRFDFGTSDTATAVAALPDGGVLATGWFQNKLTVLRLRPDGDFDPAFGTVGRVDLTGRLGTDPGPTTVTALPDGRVLVAAGAWGGTLTALRLNPDGTPDPTFDGDGAAVVGVGDYVDHAWVEAAAVGPDGRIVLAGAVGLVHGTVPFVVRLNPDGSPDATFDGDGVKTLPPPPVVSTWTAHDTATGVALTPDGSTVVSALVRVEGYSGPGTAERTDVVVTRLTADGSVDPAFGVGGRFSALRDGGLPWREPSDYPAGNARAAGGVLLAPDGRVYVAATLELTAPPGAYAGPAGFRTVLRLTAGGRIDPTFGGAGFVRVTEAYREEPPAVGFLPDGRLVAAGAPQRFDIGPQDAGRVVVLADDGTPDAAFAAGATALGVPLWDPNDPGRIREDNVAALAVGAGGRVVIAGHMGYFGDNPLGFQSRVVVVALSDRPEPPAPPPGPDEPGPPAAESAEAEPPAEVHPPTPPPGVPLVEAVGSRLRVTAADGTVRTFAPYEDAFTGGLSVVTADLDGDGVPEVVVAPGAGGAARVQVFAVAGGELVQRANFFAFAGDEGFRGGADVAAGDVTGDGAPDLVVAAGAGGGPRVAVFDGRGLLHNAGSPEAAADFFAFADPGFLGGVSVAVADVTGDGAPELLAGAGAGGAPRVAVFDAAALAADPPAARVADFFAGDPAGRDGARFTAADVSELLRPEPLTPDLTP